ncbi:hypothetical protein ND861_09515 [Leptospira sp. 2 VSF19]|uniref:MORN repeat protein n=1 Tax=Leptospira soteropolitanensis TaxID=2950025 RepID=A0AAW5VN55_9LEPT|nr:hypothetical protein [Leptospira soteropolitanensis]MCW7492557.1 hypothetical protein [Leptospira soteropolitanensis]MCW7500605.1 hypothetical protein [Leptospira soteropolitanensis]MCW7522725.1 hypothetical protein [Leptospira soteropolitanensis]MCW7526581.1 hypothetical protein [Leptospira soteropolitanensis]MCW7530575.1 hypothetical protein [Leptospira soteropolitanensis]
MKNIFLNHLLCVSLFLISCSSTTEKTNENKSSRESSKPEQKMSECLMQKSNPKAGEIQNNKEYYHFKKKDQKIYPGKCIAGDCISGLGEMVFPSGSTYKGEFRNGKFDGFGRAESCSNYLFEGTFTSGIATEGIATFPGGQIHEGIWDKDARLIKGKRLYTDGGVEEGEFDPITGVLLKGKMIDPEGNIYEGLFDKNGFLLNGKSFFKNGIKFEGSIKNHVLKGKTIYPSGVTFIGNLSYDENIEIKGKKIVPDGTIYEGIFDFRTKLLTKGIAIFPDGNIREGIFDPETGYLINGKAKYPNGIQEVGVFNRETGIFIDLEKLERQVFNESLKSSYHQWEFDRDGCIDKWNVTFQNNTKKTISSINFILIIKEIDSVIRYQKAHSVKLKLNPNETSPSPYFKLNQRVCPSGNNFIESHEFYADVTGYK